jgi:hypothetical protein
MRRWSVRSFLLLTVVWAGWAEPAWAQNREKAWELYPYVGYFQFNKKAGLKDSPSYGLNFAYHWTKKQEIEFGFEGTSTKDKATGNFSADLTVAHVNYIYNIFLQRRGKVVAFVTGGGGIVGFSTFGFTTNSDLVGDEQKVMYNYGGGIRFFGGRRAGFRLDARKVYYSTNIAGKQDYFEATIGLDMVLGGS